jgi:hypothetical protein
MAGFWSTFFRVTRSAYKAQHAGRTVRAFASGSSKRIVKLYERRLLYKMFARIGNKLTRW